MCPNQLSVEIELNEMVRLPLAIEQALVGRLIVNRLTRLVRHIRGPIRQAWQLLRDAGAVCEIGPLRLSLLIRLLRRCDGLSLLAFRG